MAKFTDKQVLQLITERLKELNELIPSNDSDDVYLSCYHRGQRSIVDSLQFCLDFYSNYEFD